MLWIPSKKTRRFTLYHLQQNQIYIRDFSGLCSYIDPVTNDEHVKVKGKFYICSKTIVFEAEQQSIPIMKFKYEHMRNTPALQSEQDPNGKKPLQFISFVVRRMTTIRCSSMSPPEPFKHHQDLDITISMYASYESPAKLMDWLELLFAYGKKKAAYDLEERIYDLIIEKENKQGFNMSLVDSVSEKPLHEETNILARRILPLNHISGYMFITDAKVYFEPFHSLSGKAVNKIEVLQIAKLFKRRFELREIGMEIITEKGKSYYFTFDNTGYRNRLYNALSSKVSEKCVKVEFLQQITYMWQNKEISNYDYLMHLNQVGNRSFSDLSQYPVFPWVLSDYVSQTLDLQNYKTYRDLSKPIGALNPQRLKGFLDRYQDMPPPKFLYGSHYSAPGYVIGYLVRMKPEYMLKLQSGKFDKADRLFKSIKGDWQNVMENPTSLKQLIPEFYQNNPSFLLNSMNLDLGTRQNKKKVHDVKLPKWAKNDPMLFLETMRKALESDYVSNHLHLWIDLIFGSKQRGEDAVKANNLFNYMTYEGMVDFEQIIDPIEKMGVKCQINEFGQCPRQIFKIAHPPRGALTVLNSIPHPLSEEPEQKQSIDEKPVETSPIKALQTTSLYSSSGIPKLKTVLTMGKSTEVRCAQIPKAHKMAITRICMLSSRQNTVLTVGQDGFLKVFDIQQKTCQKSFKICDFCLSSIVPLKGDQLFAIGSWDNNIYIFNIVYGSKSKPICAHDNSVSDLLYLPKSKRLVSSSWDCSIKIWRVAGSNLDNETIFHDHDNQITCLAVDEQETMLAFGDIEGNIIVMNLDERERVCEAGVPGQKIARILFIKNNIIAAGETDIKLLDTKGKTLTSFKMQPKNGNITDIALDGEHLFSLTTKKHLGVYDILQEKKLGSYFNDFKNGEQDKLPNEKELNCLAVGADSTVVMVGSASGNLYILRS